MKIFPILILIVISVGLFFLGKSFPENSSENIFILGIVAGVIPTLLVEVIFNLHANLKYWKLVLKTHLWYRWFNDYIRLSISYIYRIKIDNNYLLVKGQRINQFQPVGGVYKRFPESISMFQKLGVRDDNCIPIDDDSRDDLRVRVPSKNVVKFIKWFYSKKDRENCQWREFCEELLETGILDRNIFKHIQSRYLGEKRIEYVYSDYYKCREILLYEIYELIPTDKQTKFLNELLKKPVHVGIIFANEDLIRSLGHNNYTQKKDYAISEHSKYIL